MMLTAKLPTLDQAGSLLIGVMVAPVTKLARTANEILQSYKGRSRCAGSEEEAA